MSDDLVKEVAAIIRREIDMLLSNYCEACQLIFDDEKQGGSDRIEAEERISAFEWLRETWTSDAKASEERLEGVARAVLEHLGRRG